MNQGSTLRKSTSVNEFLNDLRQAGVLVNTDLESDIRNETNATRILNAHQMRIVRGALDEMKRREVGVYTAAAIIIAAINSFAQRGPE